MKVMALMGGLKQLQVYLGFTIMGIGRVVDTRQHQTTEVGMDCVQFVSDRLGLYHRSPYVLFYISLYCLTLVQIFLSSTL